MLASSPAEARYNPGKPDPDELAPFYVIAIAFPNLYLQIDGDSGDLGGDLGWPVVLRALDLEVGDFGSVHGHLFGEARADLDDWAWRGVFGGRVGLLPEAFGGFGFFGEGGYFIGEDGRGALLGGGLSYEFDYIGATALLSYRATPADSGVTHSVTVDFDIPIPLFELYQ